jgi:hypothetical protein
MLEQAPPYGVNKVILGMERLAWRQRHVADEEKHRTFKE